MKLPVAEIKKIAVFRALQLGDMLCAIPAICCLRLAYPKAEIVLLGLPWARSFVQRFYSYFDRFIHFPGYEGLPEQEFEEEKFNKFIHAIQEEKFDLVLQMQGNGTIVNTLLFEFGARYVAGFYTAESCVDSDLFMPYPDHGPEINRHLMLMNHLGMESCSPKLEFPLFQKDTDELSALNIRVQKKNYVCIHPGSRGVWRQWPPQYFAALADFCLENKYAVVVTGTEEERDITRELIKCIHHPVIDLTGKTSLGAVALLIRNAFMLIANCTGVSHIAAALQTPSIIISMDGEPGRWASLNTAIHKTIDCKNHLNFNEVYTEMVKLAKAGHTTALSHQPVKSNR